HELGASNLLRFHDWGCVAHNTDYAGMRAVWRDRFGATPPGRVAIAGAGGVCRALVLALLDAGAERIAVWDLDPAKAEAVAAVSERVVPCDVARAGAEAAAATGLVNATPLGMHAYPGTAFDTDWLSGAEWAFDAVYTPIVTPFVAACRARGIETLTGFDLFRHMAVASFAIYADRPAPAGAADTLHALARGLD
ncbi:MAG: shikimate dehydrogenase, partial [Pseudomonadota bacterium]